MEKVAILISTYNGEKYLREQLDSIINQTYKNIEIYIRDDGSKDSTCEILKEYKKKYNNFHIEFGENLGFVNSFFALLSFCNDADYYAFCDQDDVWEENKIEIAVQYLEKTDKNLYYSFYSNLDFYDENMNFVKHGIKTKKFSFSNSLVEPEMTGMTIVINKKMRDSLVLNKPKNCYMHDWWIYLVTSSLGNVIYYDKSLVKYRRHGKVVTPSGKNDLKLFLWRIKEFIINDSLKEIKKQNIEFNRIYGKDLNKEDKKLLDLFTTEKYCFIKTIKKAFYPKRFRTKLMDEIMLRFLFIIGKL